MKREHVKLPLTNSWVFHWILSLISTITESKTTFLRQSRWKYRILHFRSSPPEVFLGNVVLKIYSKFTGEHQCRSVICNFIKTTLRYECSPVNLAYFFRNTFSEDHLWNFVYFTNNFKLLMKESLPNVPDNPFLTEAIKSFSLGLFE